MVKIKTYRSCNYIKVSSFDMFFPVFFNTEGRIGKVR